MINTKKWEKYKKLESEKKELKLRAKLLITGIKELKRQLREILIKAFEIEKEQYKMIKGVKNERKK